MKIRFATVSISLLIAASTLSPGTPPLIAAEASMSHGAILQAPGKGADATPLLKAAIAEAARKGGGKILLSAGDFELTGSLTLPSNTVLAGEGRGITRLIAPSGADFNVIEIEGATNVTVSDLSVMEASFEARKTMGRGIVINSGAGDIRVINVAITGFSSCVSLGRNEEGEEVAQVTFRDCLMEKGRYYGFDLSLCRRVLLDNCQAYDCYLDGIKFRKKTTDITIRGGEASRNGTSRLANPRMNGNGVDGFAGGNAFLIDGLVTEHNQGAGIYIKTGPQKLMEGSIIANGMITNVRSRFNIGSGLDINRSKGDLGEGDEKFPLAGDMVVMGGVYEGNTRAGIFLRGRQITLLAPIVKRNEQAGIEVATGGGISIIGALVSANSAKEPGTRAGIELLGLEGSLSHVVIRDGAVNGGESTLMSDTNDLNETEKIFHRTGIYASKGVRDIVIEGVDIRNYRGAKPTEITGQ